MVVYEENKYITVIQSTGAVHLANNLRGTHLPSLCG